MNRLTLCIVAIVGAFGMSGAVFAGTVNIGNTSNLTQQVLNEYDAGGYVKFGSNFGGTVTLSNGVTLTQASFGSGTPENINGSNLGSGNTGLWTGSNQSLSFSVVYSDGQATSFGYQMANSFGNPTGGQTTLFSDPTDGQTKTITSPSSGNFLWFDPNRQGQDWYCGGGSLNSDDTCHEVCYLVKNIPGDSSPCWLFCWDDEQYCWNGNYCDLLVQCECTAVPVPASVWMGLLTLGGMGAVVGLRRRRQAA